MKIITQKIALFAIFSALLFVYVVPAQAQHNQDMLKKRIDTFYKSLSNGLYENVWKMTSKSFKEKNNNNKKEYINSLKSFEGAKLRIDIKHVEIIQDNATVSIERCLLIEENKQWLCETNSQKWVYERGKWFYDI